MLAPTADGPVSKKLVKGDGPLGVHYNPRFLSIQLIFIVLSAPPLPRGGISNRSKGPGLPFSLQRDFPLLQKQAGTPCSVSFPSFSK